MKKKNLNIIFIVLIVLAYIPFSPVFIKSVYGSQPHADFPGDRSFSYLWLTRKDFYTQHLFYGVWEFTFRQHVNIMFRSESSELRSIKIESARMEIDDQEFSLSHLIDHKLELDTGPFNIYGGSGGSGIIELSLPKDPEQKIQIHLKGIAFLSDGRQNIFDISVISEVKKSATRMPYYKYLLAPFWVT